MFGHERSIVRPDGYEQVGNRIPLGETGITADDAQLVHYFLMHDFFGRVRCRTPHVDETSDKTQYGKRYERHESDANDGSFFAGAILKHVDPHSWATIIMIAKTSRSLVNNSPLRVESRYRIGVVGEAVMESTKEVRVLRSVGELTVDDIASEAEYSAQRKAFEKVLTPDDCGQVMGQLERVARRADI